MSPVIAHHRAGSPGAGPPDPSGSGTDDFNAPPRPGRRARLWPAAVGSVGLLGLVTLMSVTGLAGTAFWGPRTTASPVAAVTWPAEGQAGVLVEGLGARGDLGTTGAQEPVPIASVTKVMTAYVILRDHPLEPDGTGARITVDEQAAGESYSGSESTVPVRAGQQLSQRHLLELMLVRSGNNIARLLARWDAGTEKTFTARMNETARELGMRHTTYTDASGIAPTNISTAADQLVLARQVMRDPVFRSVVARPDVRTPETAGPLPNTNTLLGQDGVIGIKTGSSTPAGGNLMWASVAPDRNGDSRLVLGIVLHQGAGTDPQRGMASAFDTSRTLIRDVRQWVSTTAPGPR
ncbi:hypothetical protein GCM10010358_76860 [Streptomyces minutiscleroticus]|uniref:Peptidase S11 D-alanyl-D-alanine carboxypeptidase A N-terminal domain-containing protein n=1 Tax=Streptomyces minutiscleroticus TaxID=68238 RepID=A0A918U9G1_9ACTN|nr:serine hydrolase [Streptomyces minutiscleroticus]GGY13194.1 hypothetical protein GCM10010358_76860 [Streptomyces minutiscleroticus]